MPADMPAHPGAVAGQSLTPAKDAALKALATEIGRAHV